MNDGKGAEREPVEDLPKAWLPDRRMDHDWLRCFCRCCIRCDGHGTMSTNQSVWSSLSRLPILTTLGGSFDRSILAKCLDLNAVAYANAGIGIFQDVLILLLPFPEIVYLNMRTRKKVILILMFLLGTFAVLTSILRLPSLHEFATSTDQTCKQTTIRNHGAGMLNIVKGITKQALFGRLPSNL